MAKKEGNWIKRHPVWTGVMGVIILFIIIGIFSGGNGNDVLNEDAQNTDDITFSKSINDPANDCISSQTGEAITCNEAVDIISASIDQKDGIATVDIELAGDVPLQDELKVGDLGTETYQYQVWAKINEKWSNVLFGDITDTLGVSGGCGFNTISCDNSQVDFSVIGNSVKITGPLILQITQFRIKTLYESGSMEEDDVIDDVEG